jgi:hypothetical protein
MKSTTTTFFAALAVGGLLAGTSAFAQDSTTNAAASTNAMPHMVPHAVNIDGIARALNLTDDEKTQVQPILNAEFESRREIITDKTLSGDEKRQKVIDLHNQTATKLKPILTDEQFKRWSMMAPHMRRLTPPPPLMPASTNAPAAPAATTPPLRSLRNNTGVKI